MYTFSYQPILRYFEYLLSPPPKKKETTNRHYRTLLAGSKTNWRFNKQEQRLEKYLQVDFLYQEIVPVDFFFGGGASQPFPKLFSNRKLRHEQCHSGTSPATRSLVGMNKCRGSKWGPEIYGKYWIIIMVIFRIIVILILILIIIIIIIIIIIYHLSSWSLQQSTIHAMENLQCRCCSREFVAALHLKFQKSLAWREQDRWNLSTPVDGTYVLIHFKQHFFTGTKPAYHWKLNQMDWDLLYMLNRAYQLSWLPLIV